jgi:DNA-binding GntR family transcriptional regulator
LGRLEANWYYLPDMPDVPRCHSLLVDAIKARDPEKADAEIRAHIQNGLQKELRVYRMWGRFRGKATTAG